MNLVTEFTSPRIEWYALSPYLVLLGGVLVFLVAGPLLRNLSGSVFGGVAAATAGAAGTLAVLHFLELSDNGPRTLVRGALAQDRFGLLAVITICVAVVLTSMTMTDSDRVAGASVSSGSGSSHLLEPYSLLLTAALGGAIMVSANDLVVTFLGVEILSLSFYVLTASDRRRRASQEAGLKYFILGGFASAFLLYGIALVYGATGQTSLDGISRVLSSEIPVPRNDTLLLAGIALLLVGFAFKVSLVPFHSWVPDVYQGAPTPVTGFMASLGKVAAIVAMLRFFAVAFPTRADDWRPAILVLSIVTLVVGSVLAVVQTDVKRMLAYSSVSHAGFMLVGLEAYGRVTSTTSGEGVSAALIYVVLYSVLVIGSFTVVAVVSRSGDTSTSTVGATSLDAFNGLAKSNPVLALAFTTLLLAQAGVPLTSGFVAKFGVIRSAVITESYVLAIVAMVSAVIAAYLYLRIMISMWLSDSVGGGDVVVGVGQRVTLALSVAVTLVVGVLPTTVLRLSDSLTLFLR